MTDTGGPAFPGVDELGDPYNGMTLRQYAAIHLKVPNSGTDWLDDMIRQSLRDDFAAKAPMPSNGMGADFMDKAATFSYAYADSKMKARGQ
jgi:hypothetical protein